MRQAFQCVAQPRIGLLTVGFAGFDQTVKLCAGCGALGVSLKSQFFLPMTNGRMARSVASCERAPEKVGSTASEIK